MHSSTIKSCGTIIIPAYNEASVIKRTLMPLKEAVEAGRYKLLVACNGCEDGTAAIAREVCPHSEVIEISEAGKTNALNIAIQRVQDFPLVFLDADIVTDIASIDALSSALKAHKTHLVYGNANFKTRHASIFVKWFYRAWKKNPYFDKHKVGGLFALSKTGAMVLGAFPETINDDEYVRRMFLDNSRYVANADYSVSTPRRIRDLIKVRSRVYRGNRLLESEAVALGEAIQRKNQRTFVERLLKNPSLWLPAATFFSVAISAHIYNFMRYRTHAAYTWDRDLSSRSAEG